MYKEYGKLSTKMYEITKPVGYSINGDLEFYYDKLKHVTGDILEAGVGTGRLLIPYLQKGLTIEGVDLSNEMLQQCQKNLDNANIKGKIYQGDLTCLDLEKKFQAIIMPTGSFCLLPSQIVADVLASFHAHLEKDGVLILDTELPSWFVKGEIDIQDIPLGDMTGILFTGIAKDIDWYDQKVSYSHRYELVENGKVIETELSNFELNWYGIKEFTQLLKEAGFSDIRHEVGYGDLKNDSLITFIAKK